MNNSTSNVMEVGNVIPSNHSSAVRPFPYKIERKYSDKSEMEENIYGRNIFKEDMRMQMDKNQAYIKRGSSLKQYLRRSEDVHFHYPHYAGNVFPGTDSQMRREDYIRWGIGNINLDASEIVDIQHTL